jgi:hypothetical protein
LPASQVEILSWPDPTPGDVKSWHAYLKDQRKTGEKNLQLLFWHFPIVPGLPAIVVGYITAEAIQQFSSVSQNEIKNEMNELDYI